MWRRFAWFSFALSASAAHAFNVAPAGPLSSGAFHSCALRADGTVACWGIPRDGRLGEGTLSGVSPAPRLVGGLDDATAVASGDAHTCAIRAGGAVSCWGENYFGQLGQGRAGPPSAEPIDVRL
jgi:alpha-tubulin suppressor-like RCC1 family protein